MRKRLIIELDGENENVESIERDIVAIILGHKAVSMLNDFEFRKEIISEKQCGQIEIPEFLNKSHVISQQEKVMIDAIYKKDVRNNG